MVVEKSLLNLFQPLSGASSHNHPVCNLQKYVKQSSLHCEMIVSVLVPQWLRLDQIMSGNHNVVGINLRRKSVAVALPHFNLFLMNESASGTFDVLLEGSQTWLCNYLAWRRDGGALWLVPAHTAGPFFRLSKEGLDAFEGAPYENGSQRYAGIIRAIETPSFEGRF